MISCSHYLFLLQQYYFRKTLSNLVICLIVLRRGGGGSLHPANYARQSLFKLCIFYLIMFMLYFFTLTILFQKNTFKYGHVLQFYGGVCCSLRTMLANSCSNFAASKIIVMCSVLKDYSYALLKVVVYHEQQKFFVIWLPCAQLAAVFGINK